MRPSSGLRVIAYTIWAAMAVYLGSRHRDVGELCTVLLIGAGILLGEAIAENPRRPGRAATIATVVIVIALCLRCTAEVLSWDTAALPGETPHALFARHFGGHPR